MAELPSCADVFITNAKTYLTERIDIYSKNVGSCGSTIPHVNITAANRFYVCPDGKVWDGIRYQCTNEQGRKRRKKRSLEMEGKRSKRSITTTSAFWNLPVPTCTDTEPPLFHDCPTEPLTVYKESWGPVYVNVSIPTAVDNSGISPRITITPEDFRQPYLFRENTTVTITAEDGAGNTNLCEIRVILIDIYPLTIRCPVETVYVGYVPYATVNDTVEIRYNLSIVNVSIGATHITYYPPAGTTIRIKDHIDVMATAYDKWGNTTSCNFTYEATRAYEMYEIPEYRIQVAYQIPSIETSQTCADAYGRELNRIFSNLLIPGCQDYQLLTSLVNKNSKVLITVTLGYVPIHVYNFTNMENCGNLTGQRMYELGNITMTPSGCNKLTLLAIQEDITQGMICSNNYTVFNKTSKMCMYCPKGTFSNEISGECEVCPVQGTVPGECTACSDSQTFCLDKCKPGEYSRTGLQPCTKCAVGTYTDTYNATMCHACPAGRSTVNTGSNKLNMCLDECPKGQYSQTGLVPCKPCPLMFYTNTTKSQSCIECASGLVTTSVGSSSASQCIDPRVCSNDNVCKNGGSCVPVDSGRYYTCQCASGFQGVHCEVDIQECNSNPCMNGLCIDGIDSYSCNCPAGYTGYNCDININDCDGIDCGNGTCVDGDQSFTCLCFDGFVGNRTCIERNECVPDPCQHGGICIDLIDDYVCNCSSTGYEGKNCSVLAEKCYNGSCLNGGVCHPHTAGYSCSCAQGFTGDRCQININDCGGNNCKNGAVCIDGVNTYSCLCQPGYNGSHCDTNIICNDHPCVNQGSCEASQTGFICHCLPGYTGVLCEVNIDECEQNNCNPSTSQCIDGIDGYTCKCLPGWTGTTCAEPANECLSSPCAHGSKCTDLNNQFSCSCVDGYYGYTCSTDINECRSTPCYNNGQCVDQVNGYSCRCQDSFTGTQCQDNIDWCRKSPCQNNGTCVNLVDTFTCRCLHGWTGQTCQTQVDNCLSQPCQNNATCMNAVDNFSCRCIQGFTGNLCQMDINECMLEPCLHHGKCTNLIGRYSCTCLDGYTGNNCENIDGHCPECQNGATECLSGQCSCLPGYVGPDCGKDRDYWYDLNFHGNKGIETAVTKMKNRNQLSLCMWVKVIENKSSTILTLTSVDSDPSVYHTILKVNIDNIQLSYFTETRINFTMPLSLWNLVCFTWNSEQNGHWLLYVNGVLQREGQGYGNGQELPARQKILLGRDIYTNTTFYGMVSQVNMYDSLLNVTGTSGSANCSKRMPPGTVFKWEEFSSYVVPGVEVIEPTLCGSTDCPAGYSGKYCNATKDTEPPKLNYCPQYVQVVTGNRLNVVNWTEPVFYDNVEVVNIIQTHRSGQVFAYGEYDVLYIAFDKENNTAICSFTVYVIPTNCSMPTLPPNVIMNCSTWYDGIFCSIKCKDPAKFVEEIPPFYKCGREGFWDPPRGEEFTVPSCADSSQPSGTIKGGMAFIGPVCTPYNKNILEQNFVTSMNQWNMEFGMCPENKCNFSNITVECSPSARRRRRRSTTPNYYVSFDIPINGSLVSGGDGVMPLTQLETMVKNEEFNTNDFSCDPTSLIVKPYIICQQGQILVSGLCVNCARGSYLVKSLCELCPVGQYTDEEKQVTCRICPAGSTTENPGATSLSYCYKLCKTGYHYDRIALDCKPCDLGYYQDESGKMSCKSCGNGQTTLQLGSTSVVDCKSTCGVGQELSVLGRCESCVLGTYKPGGSQDSCLSCPYGYSTENVGSTSVYQCTVVTCPPDYFYDFKIQKCQVCPPAYHQPQSGQSSCIPCTKFDTRIKCLSGEIDECALNQDDCDQNADCIDTTDHYNCNCKPGYKGNGTTCVDKCMNACDTKQTCIIDNNGEPLCKDNPQEFPLLAVALGASSFVLLLGVVIIIVVFKRRSEKRKKERTTHYHSMDRVHRELEVVTYPRRIPVSVAFRTNPAYSDSELSDPTLLRNPSPMWPIFTDHEDLSKYSETSLRRPLRLRITAAMKNDQQFEIESNTSWHDSSPGSSLSQYREDSLPHHSSPNSSISKYRVDSNPQDSSPNSSISQYKEDSLHKNDSPISNKSDFSDSYF